MENLFNELARAGVDINFFNFTWGKKWTCILKREAKGDKLELQGESEDPVEAVQIAYDKFRKATESGLPDFSLKVIEARTPDEVDEREDV